MEASKPSAGADFLFFLVSLVIMIAMLIYMPAWFWVALPFVLTYLVRFFNAM